MQLKPKWVNIKMKCCPHRRRSECHTPSKHGAKTSRSTFTNHSTQHTQCATTTNTSETRSVQSAAQWLQLRCTSMLNLSDACWLRRLSRRQPKKYNVRKIPNLKHLKKYLIYNLIYNVRKNPSENPPQKPEQNHQPRNSKQT